MQLSSDTASRTEQMISDCGLDTLSIFFRDKNGAGESGLRYLYHHGISREAQAIYRTERVFEDDPFPLAVENGNRCGRLIRWGDQRLNRYANAAADYRSFIASHGVDVVGAWVQRVLPDLYLVIGAHCKPGGHKREAVPLGLLEGECNAIGQMVVGDLVNSLVSGPGGETLIAMALHDDHDDEQDPLGALSPREKEIALLVGQGKQNKQIAYMIGISQFTVENHLRRVYRKLDVHNRTAMSVRLSKRPTH